MPVAVAFSKPDTVLVHASGEVTYAECQRAIDAILANPALAHCRKLLVDGRTVTGAPGTKELRQIVRDVKPLFDRHILAMAIVTDQTFVYGVARMFAVFAEAFGLTVRAFREMEDAELWLASSMAPFAQ